MNHAPTFLSTLVHLLRRDGMSFFTKCARFAFSAEAWRWLLHKETDPVAVHYQKVASRMPKAPPDLPPAERERSRRILQSHSPEVSIVVAIGHNAGFLRETLDSLAAQTYGGFEVLVADDGVADGIADTVQEFAAKDNRFSLVRHEGGEHGFAAGTKRGIESAKGEYVAFCEAGDLWTPDHLEKKIGFLRERWGEPNFLVNEVDMIGDKYLIRGMMARETARSSAQARTRNRIPPAAFREWNWISTFSMCMVRRSVLLACDMCPVPRAADFGWWLWRQICFQNDIWCIHEKLTQWRLSPELPPHRVPTAQAMADERDGTARMDRLLCERNPLQAETLRPFLRPEDDFSCRDGHLEFHNQRLSSPRFSLLVPTFGPPAAVRRTLESIAAQTYGHAEILLVGREGEFAASGDWKSLFSGTIPPSSVRHVPCRFPDLHALAQAALPLTSGDWVSLVLPGDILRPEALQVFAARALLNPEADGFWAVSRCEESAWPIDSGEGKTPVPLAPPGACVVRRSLAVSPDAPHLADYPEADFLACACRRGKAIFINHEVLIHDDAPDGLDSFGKRVFQAGVKLARLGKTPLPPSLPDSVEGDIPLVARSRYFDAAWYLHKHPNVHLAGVHPATHYALFGKTPNCNPSAHFTGDEYFAVNPDIGPCDVRALVHFERHGRTEGRLISFLENDRPAAFPGGTVALQKTFPVRAPDKKRTAIFAGNFADGRIPATDVIYLRGLREVADNVIYVCDNPVFPDETGKIEGIVCAALFGEHGGGEFGSYKRGWLFAKEHGLLRPGACGELVFANHSCYGPVFPFAETFGAMSRRTCDFWGLSAKRIQGRDLLDSSFIVVRRPVLDGSELDAFLDSVAHQPTRGHAVMRYEREWTKRLADAGYTFDSLVPVSFHRRKGVDPSRMPVTIMETYRYPLLRAATVNGDSRESVDRALEIARENNPDLAEAIVRGTMKRPHERMSIEDFRASLAGTVSRVTAKAAAGKALRAVFLVASPSMFPARPLFDAMRADPAFDAKIFVEPDLRGFLPNPGEVQRACRAELGRTYPDECFLDAEPDEFGLWPDVLKDADIVCYPSPYELSCFRFNPHYAAGRNFLPIHVNYGYYRSLYDREVVGMQNYAYFWKAFFECGATAEEYAAHSILKGANADVVGYVKMDALAAAKPWPRNGNRKRVLIAPHHSVEGGANNTLALSNFQRYADYFLSLPERHPELDFVFRPHPFLFTVLAKPDKWGKAKVDDWIARMKAHPNVRWSGEGDYFPVFVSCDAIVQDCGSYLVEWFYTGKPCCYLLKEPADIDAKFAPLGKECLSHCYVAYEQADIDAFLRGVVEEGNDPKAAAREEFRKTIMVNHPHAAQAALASIKRDLGMR